MSHTTTGQFRPVPTQEITHFSMFRWPLSDKANIAVISLGSPSTTGTGVEFDLKGVTDEEQIQEMTDRVASWGCSNITQLSGACVTFDEHGELPVVGIAFTNNGSQLNITSSPT